MRARFMRDHPQDQILADLDELKEMSRIRPAPAPPPPPGRAASTGAGEEASTSGTAIRCGKYGCTLATGHSGKHRVSMRITHVKRGDLQQPSARANEARGEGEARGDEILEVTCYLMDSDDDDDAEMVEAEVVEMAEDALLRRATGAGRA